MITTEGLNHQLSVSFKGAAQNTTWYVAPFKNDYTPSAADVAATVSTLAGESTAYEGSTRAAVAFGTPSNGGLDNSASLVTLTATGSETWYGAMLISTPTKGATSGVLAAVKRFDSPRAMTAGAKLEILVDLDLTQPA